MAAFFGAAFDGGCLGAFAVDEAPAVFVGFVTAPGLRTGTGFFAGLFASFFSGFAAELMRATAAAISGDRYTIVNRTWSAAVWYVQISAAFT